MIRLWAALMAMLALIAAAPVDVTVTPDWTGSRYSALRVAHSFAGDADGETRVQLPSEWAGETGLYDLLRDVLVDGGDLQVNEQPSLLIIRHAPGARLNISYRVLDGANGREGARANVDAPDFRPRVRRDFFLAVGATIFSEIIGRDDGAPARFRLVGLPTGADFASDLEHPGLTYGKLFSSVLIGGDIRVINAGDGARLALRGAVTNKTDAAWRDSFTVIAKAQRHYWGAAAGPFLVTVLTLPRWDGPNTAVGGSGLGDAFAAFAGADASATNIDEVIGHEMMHSWIPDAIGGVAKDEAQRGDYWLSEGFTDWASWRVMMRAKLWGPDDFAAAFNARLGGYDSSRLRTAPNATITAGFWSDPEARDLAYQRGMLLAVHWDDLVRTRTNGARGFDHVLWRMRDLARAGDGRTAADLLVQAMREVSGVDIGGEIERYVVAGDPAPLRLDIFVPCGFILRQDGVRQLRLAAALKRGEAESCRRVLAGE
jgi:predicted metalloprotease with PDZ domain